ncbi:Putative oxidoreductase, short-chain dehydrogenase/reductase family protein [Carnobacterium sp. AT7]|uniref:elongation factor P 5-aminopentanone reductase n=1 Tax=Carnobacterium TaxID=2747 RepID=UPI00015F197C|nr:MULTISPECIES: SDR family oxidoreductase [Carnobacterium]EDP68521.1 Putative oxidoreductase, short-chain dehydrogenase/reductase family protein [Carnobacterium sp. AT7]
MKFALIMGASGDIGKGIAQEMAEKGWSLYLHYHSNPKSVEEQIRNYQMDYPKQDFFALPLDMTEEEGISLFLQSIYQLDVVVFASGFTTYQLLTEISSTDMDRMWRVHVKTPVLLVQHLQDKLAHSTHGRIIFISSIYGEIGSAMEVFYSTTKGAQLAFVKAYSKEVASLGITVNAISPGAIATKMNQDFTPAEVEELESEIPLGRLGNVSEISFWVTQLVDKRSAYMTGQSIVVSGGWLK